MMNRLKASHQIETPHFQLVSRTTAICFYGMEHSVNTLDYLVAMLSLNLKHWYDEHPLSTIFGHATPIASSLV
jgi:hypothetical protein